MAESRYQSQLIKELRERFPGCVIIKNPSHQIQGIPDLTIFYGECWAMLEVKASVKAKRQPNQPHYVEKMNKLSFAAFICPENEEEVLSALQRSFKRCGPTCVSGG